MKLELMVLDKNINNGENNHNETWEAISIKLEEEYQELQEAIREPNNKAHLGEEILDVIQVCIRALVLLAKEHCNLEQIFKRHNKKLVKRGWKHEKIIKIFIKE